MRFNYEREIMYTFPFILLGITICSFYELGKGVEVDSSYINGLLTAMSVLFVFWILILQKEPRAKGIIIYEKGMQILFLSSLFLFVFSVVLISLTAVKSISTFTAFLVLLGSFLFNFLSIVIASGLLIKR